MMKLMRIKGFITAKDKYTDNYNKLITIDGRINKACKLTF